MWRITLLLVSAILILSAGASFPQQYFEQNIQKPWENNRLASMPLAFTENHGQWGEKTLFRVEAGGAVFSFCQDEVAYLFIRNGNEIADNPFMTMGEMPDRPHRPRYEKEALLIKAKFVGANPYAEVIGENRLSHDCNYFYGSDPDKWRADVPNYSSIRYKDVWPGVDIRYCSNSGTLKYDFIVDPDADIHQIKICYEDIDGLDITFSGDLRLATQFGPILEKAPIIYQEIGGKRTVISGAYEVLGQRTFGIRLNQEPNPDYPLVIDPELAYSTYLGGIDWDYAFALAVDGNYCAIVTGFTSSYDFPILNPYDGQLHGDGDIFVTKLSPAGNSLEFSTFIGGVLHDEATNIALDPAGNIVLIGSTTSMDLPMVGAYDDSYNGECDAFVARLSNAGNELLYSTYYGGTSDDFPWMVAIDNSNSIYVTGFTYSADLPTISAFDPSHNGGDDIFVFKLSPGGEQLQYSTFLGGSSEERGFGLAVDRFSCAYVTGFTGSSDFPTLNAYDNTFNGYRDTYVTKLNSSGDSLVYSTYIGGASDDGGWRLSVDNKGWAYVTGSTFSSDYPTVFPFDGNYNGDRDIFVTKVSPYGDYLQYSSYFGGNGVDYIISLEIDNEGHSYLSGLTTSYNLPLSNPYDESYNGETDAFVAELSTVDSSLVFSTYLGGSSFDGSYGLAVDSARSIYVSGRTNSVDFPVFGAYDPDNNGGGEIFVTKFGQQVGVSTEPKMPAAHSLLTCYPNPFNAQTRLNFSIAEPGNVQLEIFDMLGQRIAIPLEGYFRAGSYSCDWNAFELPSGLYFVTLHAGNIIETRKVTLLK